MCLIYTDWNDVCVVLKGRQGIEPDSLSSSGKVNNAIFQWVCVCQFGCVGVMWGHNWGTRLLGCIWLSSHCSSISSANCSPHNIKHWIRRKILVIYGSLADSLHFLPLPFLSYLQQSSNELHMTICHGCTLANRERKKKITLEFGLLFHTTHAMFSIVFQVEELREDFWLVWGSHVVCSDLRLSYHTIKAVYK